MKTASLKSKGGFVLNATTNRYEWDNDLVNDTELVSLYSDDIWYIFSHKVIRSSNQDSPFGEPGAQPYSYIADLFTTEDADYLLFFDRDNIFANSANFTQIYNPDYYTFTIYKQPNFSAPPNVHDAYDLVSQYCQVQSAYLNRLKFSPAYIDDEKIVFKANTQLVRTVDDTGNDGVGLPPVISCIPTSFNVTQIQGDVNRAGNVIAVASIWYEGQEYPYITTADQMAYLVPNVTSAKLRFGGGFRTGILMHYDAYNAYPEYCKALVIARYTTDNYFVAGASNDNLVAYMQTASIWDGGDTPDRIFKSETMKAINEPSEIRLTRLSTEMSEFIKTYGGDAGVFLNGNYNVNNLVDMVNQGNDIIINACVKVESNLLPSSEPAIT